MQEKILTPDQVAQILQVHPFTVLKFIKQGKLKASKLGRVYRIRESDVESFLELSSSVSTKTHENDDKNIKKSKNKNKISLNKEKSAEKASDTAPEQPQNQEEEVTVQVGKVDIIESTEGAEKEGGDDEYYILQ